MYTTENKINVMDIAQSIINVIHITLIDKEQIKLL